MVYTRASKIKFRSIDEADRFAFAFLHSLKKRNLLPNTFMLQKRPKIAIPKHQAVIFHTDDSIPTSLEWVAKHIDAAGMKVLLKVVSADDFSNLLKKKHIGQKLTFYIRYQANRPELYLFRNFKKRIYNALGAPRGFKNIRPGLTPNEKKYQLKTAFKFSMLVTTITLVALYISNPSKPFLSQIPAVAVLFAWNTFMTRFDPYVNQWVRQSRILREVSPGLWKMNNNPWVMRIINFIKGIIGGSIVVYGANGFLAFSSFETFQSATRTILFNTFLVLLTRFYVDETRADKQPRRQPSGEKIVERGQRSPKNRDRLIFLKEGLYNIAMALNLTHIKKGYIPALDACLTEMVFPVLALTSFLLNIRRNRFQFATDAKNIIERFLGRKSKIQHQKSLLRVEYSDEYLHYLKNQKKKAQKQAA